MAKHKRPRKKAQKMRPRKRREFTAELEAMEETDADDIPETALGGGKK